MSVLKGVAVSLVTLAGLSLPAYQSSGWRFDGGRGETIRLADDERPTSAMTVAFRFTADPGTKSFPCVQTRGKGFMFSCSRGFSWYAVDGTNRRICPGYAHPRLLEFGRTYHVAFVYDQTGLEVYFDGRRIQRLATENAGEVQGLDGPIVIGEGFKGRISDFRLLDRAIRDWPEERARADALRKPPKASSAPLTVYSAHAMDWVHPENFAPKAPARRIRMLLAGNERESVQFFAVPRDGARTRMGVRVASEGFVSKSGRKAGLRVDFHRIVYSPVDKPSHYMYELEAFPDWLERTNVILRAGLPYFPVWMDVTAPSGTEPGVYTGQIEFSCGKGAYAAIPVEVEVCAFEFPQRNPVPTAVLLWERDILTYAGGNRETFLDLIAEYGEMLLEHRLNPIYLHEPRLICDRSMREAAYPLYRAGADGRDETDWRGFDQVTERLLKRGLSRIVAGPSYGNVKEWDAAQDREAAWKSVRDHLAEKGWLKDAIAYPIDEWMGANLPRAVEVGETIRRAAPGLKWLVTGANSNYPAPQDLPNVDIWCPQVHWVNPLEKDVAQREGKEMWYYVCTGPQFPVPNLHADTPLAAIRMVAGLGLRFGFDGFLHWGANFNTGRKAKRTGSYEFGEGMYVLADGDGHPVPTCRLRALGDGMDDWSAFELLKRRDPGAAARLLSDLGQIIPERDYDRSSPISIYEPSEASYKTFLGKGAFYDVYTDATPYLAWRERLYRQLSKTSPPPDRLADVREITLEGEYRGHLQDVWSDGGKYIYWAHTKDLLKTDLEGRVLKDVKVEEHHAGLDGKDGRLFVAVCPMQGKTKGKTTPECRVTVCEYDMETLDLIERHVTDINDRAGSLVILKDGTFLVGCLRPQDITRSQVRFHHLDRDFRLIATHVLDNVPVKVGIETLKRKGDSVYLGFYGWDVNNKDLGFDAIRLDGNFTETWRGKLDMACGLIDGGDCHWIGKTTYRKDKDDPGNVGKWIWTSKLRRVRRALP